MDLRLIEIEIYSYCNRKCKFCPNHLVPFRQDKKNAEFLDFTTYQDLIDQILKLGYHKVISFSRYNEPLAFPMQTKRYVDYAREVLDCKFVANTNGDYIDDKTIDIFDELSIMDYGNRGSTFWRERLLSLGLTEENSDEQFLRFVTKNNNKVLVFLEFKKNATVEDRGGIIATDGLNMKNGGEVRKRPCHEPKHFLGIDYNGDVMICCNMLSEFHETYVLGNVYKHKLKKLLDSDKRKRYIDIMSSENWKNYLEPCYTCQKDPGRYTRDEPGIEYKGERK